jgi:hypothetical protein
MSVFNLERKGVNVNEFKSSFSFVQQISSCANFINSTKKEKKRKENKQTNRQTKTIRIIWKDLTPKIS